MKIFVTCFSLMGCLSFPAFAGDVYRFPGPAHLREVSSWAIQEASFIRQEGTAELRYVLPKRLVGARRVEISLSGESRNGMIFLKGPLGEASCISSSLGTTCLISLKSLEIDLGEVEKFLRETSASELEVSQRMEIAGAFGNEPIGILELGP